MHSIFECVYQIWDIYIIFKAMSADCMKLELDVWHHPLDVHSKFQTDISKHVQKSPENFLLAGSSGNTPFRVFLSAREPKISQPLQKSVGIKTPTI